MLLTKDERNELHTAITHLIEFKKEIYKSLNYDEETTEMLLMKENKILTLLESNRAFTHMQMEYLLTFYRQCKNRNEDLLQKISKIEYNLRKC